MESHEPAALDPSLPIRRSPRLSSEQSTPGRGKGAQLELDVQSDQVTGQPPPPSPLAASQRPYRIQLSRAKRNLHGANPRAIGSLSILQTLTAFLQCIGEHYSATGQDQLASIQRRALHRSANLSIGPRPHGSATCDRPKVTTQDFRPTAAPTSPKQARLLRRQSRPVTIRHFAGSDG